MLKRILKSALIASMVLGGSSMVLAEDTELTMGAYGALMYGQADTGVEGENADLVGYGVFKMSVKAKKGNMILSGEMESDPGYERDGSGSDGSSVTMEANVTAKYKVSMVTPIGLLSMGRLQNNIASKPVTSGGGIKASDGTLGNQIAPTFAGSGDATGIDLLLPIGNIAIEATMYDQGVSEFRTGCSVGMKLCQDAEGSATALGVNAKFGSVTARAGMVNEVIGGNDDADDDPLAASYMHVGASMEFGSMTVGLSMVNSSVEMAIPTAMSGAITGVCGATTKSCDTDKLTHTMTVMGFLFAMKDLGPGTLNVGIETLDWSESHLDAAEEVGGAAGGAVGSFSMTATRWHLIYDVEVEKGAGYQFIYNTGTQQKKYEGNDATTGAFIGGALYAKF